MTDSQKTTEKMLGPIMVQIIKDQRADLKQIRKLIQQLRKVEEGLLLITVRMDAVQDKVDHEHP